MVEKKAHDHPYSLLFSFYQLKIVSIVAPSESMKFPIIAIEQLSFENFSQERKKERIVDITYVLRTDSELLKNKCRCNTNFLSLVGISISF